MIAQPAVSDPLTRVATVRFSEGEYARLQLAAADHGVSVSTLIRDAILTLPLPPPRPPVLDTEAVMQLRRLGVNLNQCVKIFSKWAVSTEESRREAWAGYKLAAADLRTHIDALVQRLGTP